MTRIHYPSRLVAIGALVLLASAACNFANVEPTPTPTQAITSGGGEGGGDVGGGVGQSDSGNEGEPAEDTEDIPDSEPISASAECLVGTWAADHESFAGYMQDAYESSAAGSGIELIFGTGTGDLFMSFTSDGLMSVSGDDFQVDVEIPALSAQFTFFVNADGSAMYAADDMAIATWDFQYSSDASGEGVVMGSDTGEATAVINVTPDRLWGYSSAEGFTYPVEGAPEEARPALYTCEGDTLILGAQDYQPVLWNRVN